MNILLIGSGGREHSIAVSLNNSSDINIYCSPGNAGIAKIANIINLDISNHLDVIEFCNDYNIDLVVIGPEKPLSEGVADSMNNAKIPVFGPSKNAAKLEWSKDYAKQFMQKYNIPTAKYSTFSSDEIDTAIDFVNSMQLPIVLKADGLAAGKGVVIAYSYKEAEDSLHSIFSGEFGDAGAKVVIEEFLEGEEASIFAICDGNDYITLAPSQDHKRIYDDDKGKNTGGMGAYAPTQLVSDIVLNKVKTDIIDKVVAGMKSEGGPYIGCLYVGLMIHNCTPSVVEFNCRFGDPETQPVLSIFKGNFANLLLSAAKGKIDKSAVENIADGFATCVILASDGYPDRYDSGMVIGGTENMPNRVFIYHSGTKISDGNLLSAGGRVLGVTAVADNLKESIDLAYHSIEKIHFDNMYFRKDIGAKGLKYI